MTNQNPWKTALTGATNKDSAALGESTMSSNLNSSISFNVKRKHGYLIGEVIKPADEDPALKTWRSENSLIIAWLVNLMEPAIGKPFMFLPTNKDVWDTVRDTYFDLENSLQIFGLKSKLWHAKQGFNKELDEVRGRILGKSPLPTICGAFSEVQREEARKSVMLNKLVPITTNLEVESFALVTRGFQEEVNKDGKPWCDHCKHPWHTWETCWKIHSKPQNWKKKYDGEGRAL
nr:uncharacterized protein LOC125421570 [Ziziphus jujuba var. spinosa]